MVVVCQSSRATETSVWDLVHTTSMASPVPFDAPLLMYRNVVPQNSWPLEAEHLLGLSVLFLLEYLRLYSQKMSESHFQKSHGRLLFFALHRSHFIRVDSDFHNLDESPPQAFIQPFQYQHSFVLNSSCFSRSAVVQASVFSQVACVMTPSYTSRSQVQTKSRHQFREKGSTFDQVKIISTFDQDKIITKLIQKKL